MSEKDTQLPSTPTLPASLTGVPGNKIAMIRAFHRRWSGAVIALAVYLGIDFLTNLQAFLKEVGTAEKFHQLTSFDWINFAVTSALSALTIYKATTSTRWADAKRQ